jgi:hypothetical protein
MWQLTKRSPKERRNDVLDILQRTVLSEEGVQDFTPTLTSTVYRNLVIVPLVCLPRCTSGKCGGSMGRACSEGKHELNESWAQAKRWPSYVLYSYQHGRSKFQNQIAWNFYHWNLDTLPSVALPWHCRPVGTIKIGSLCCHWRAVCNWLPRSEWSGSHLLMSLWRFVWIWPSPMWHACDIGWCQLLPPFINGGPFCHFLHLSTFVTVRWRQSEGRYIDNFRMNTRMVDTAPLIIWLV